jgi:hypothetical protein
MTIRLIVMIIPGPRLIPTLKAYRHGHLEISACAKQRTLRRLAPRSRGPAPSAVPPS